MNGNQIVNKYDAMGRKLRSTSYTLVEPLATPATGVVQLTYTLGSVKETTTTYEGNQQTTSTWPHKEQMGKPYTIVIHNSEGYVKKVTVTISEKNVRYTCYYYRRDHLGSNVAVWDATADTTLQRTFYYASGLPMRESTGQGFQQKKYGGKEFIEMYGVNEYDSEARYYYPAIGRTTTMDPLCEQYPSISPYAWCGNNPVNLIDPDGRDWYRVKNEEDDEYKILWTEYKSQEELYQADIQGEYLGEAYIDINGSYNESLSDNGYLVGEGANPAQITIYGLNGAEDIQTYDGLTISSNPEMFSMIANGEYQAMYQDMATSVYGSKSNSLSYIINTMIGSDKLPIEDGGYNKRHPEKNYMEGIFLHRTNWNGFAGYNPITQKGVSEGCIVINGRYWNRVEKQLNTSQKIRITLNRKKNEKSL